jgi:hypothetical protein
MKAVLFVLILVALFGSCFAAVADPAGAKPTKKAGERAAQLKAAAKFFRLDLHYHGDQDKPYYGLTLSVPVVDQAALDPFHPIVQISEEEAVKIIDHLAGDGFLDQAQDKAPGKPAGQPCYTLTVRTTGKGEAVVYDENLGWNAPMLKRLDGIKVILTGNAAKAMDLLLGRLAGHRKEWALLEKVASPTKIRVLFSEKPVQPERDLPKEARQAATTRNAFDHHAAFSKLVAGSISTVTVTYFDPKALKAKQDTEKFLRRLLTTPKGSTYKFPPWAQMLGVPTVAATVGHTQGKPGTWLVWDGGQSVYCAYKDGASRWWFGVWFQEEIPR